MARNDRGYALATLHLVTAGAATDRLVLVMKEHLRVSFEAEIVVAVDDYERGPDAEHPWDMSRLADAVQNEIGHTGAIVLVAHDWRTP